jgi:hypothetical protein
MLSSCLVVGGFAPAPPEQGTTLRSVAQFEKPWGTNTLDDSSLRKLEPATISRHDAGRLRGQARGDK